MSRLRFARMTDEREDPAIFGLIGAPKARIGRNTKLFQSVFEADRPVNRIGKSFCNGDSAGLRDSDWNVI